MRVWPSRVSAGRVAGTTVWKRTTLNLWVVLGLVC
jgi:hypothetical protein